MRFPRQVYRIFRGAGWANFVDPSMYDWVRNGGIIFYSVYDYDMVGISQGQKNWALNEFVNVFKSVAPAKMFICMTFEGAAPPLELPDLPTTPLLCSI